MIRPVKSACAAWAAVLAAGLAAGQSTHRVSVDSGGQEGNDASIAPRLTPDGRFVVFSSRATNLVAGDTNATYDVFVRDNPSGTIERVSLGASGVQGNQLSAGSSISADGRFVAFHSAATNLVAGDGNGVFDVFVRDRLAGTTWRVSVDSSAGEGDGDSVGAVISADGRFVAFYSLATNLVPGDTNAYQDVFVHDRLNGTTERVSVATGGAQANYQSVVPTISADGRFVAFSSGATNLVAGDTNGRADIFVRDLQAGTTELVSVATGGAQASDHSNFPALSADGHLVAFVSDAPNLVAGDTNGFTDVFVRDRSAGTTERVSVSAAGSQADGFSDFCSISADGCCVSFRSAASNLVAANSNATWDVFVRDRLSGTTERASVDSAGLQADSYSAHSSMSGDGRFVALESEATNLVAGDTNSASDIFLRDRTGPPPQPFCFGDGSSGPCPCANSGAPGRGCDNSGATGGARLDSAGSPSLAADTLHLSSSSELANAPSIVLQGDGALAATSFGDGLRCVGGNLKRLYVDSASGGLLVEPQAGAPSISARSAALGDPIAPGTTRFYQVYYRDPVLAYCPAPFGNSWNVSSGVTVVWGQ